MSTKPNHTSISDLRVLSGQYKGRRLRSPRDINTHPMGAREKLALFNIVSVSKATVLDAYAGSGALGIEALSRQAQEAIFVEKSPKAARIIRENLAALTNTPATDPGVPSRAQVFAEPIVKFSARPEFQAYFDLILADPPYPDFDAVDAKRDGLLKELAQLALLLKENGVFVLSSPAREPAPNFDTLSQISTRTYASARITVYYKTV